MKEMKRRLITGALIAFTILLILIIGGIVIFGHIQMENEGDAFIDRMLNGRWDTNRSFGRRCGSHAEVICWQPIPEVLRQQ